MHTEVSEVFPQMMDIDKKTHVLIQKQTTFSSFLALSRMFSCDEMLTFSLHSRQPGMSGQNREISRISGPVFPTRRPERTGGAKTSESRKKATLTLMR